MEWIILLIIVVAVLAVMTKGSSASFSYRLNGPLFSPAERSFLGVVDAAIGDRYRVFGKVRVADILLPQKGLNRKSWQIAFNKISAKHFDYVLCCKDTLTVIAAIELDDKSHKKKSSLARDQFLNSACESAGLKLIRFPAKANYGKNEIREKIESTIDTQER